MDVVFCYRSVVQQTDAAVERDGGADSSRDVVRLWPLLEEWSPARVQVEVRYNEGWLVGVMWIVQVVRTVLTVLTMRHHLSATTPHVRHGRVYHR